MLFCVSVCALGADSTIFISNMADYIFVSGALQLVCPFKGKIEVVAIISSVDIAFEVIKPDNANILYKLVLTWISGEPRVAITHRDLEDWGMG